MGFEGIQSVLEGLIPYTERHFQRLSRLQQVSPLSQDSCREEGVITQSFFPQLSTFLDYTWQCMKLPGDSGRGAAAFPEQSRPGAVGGDYVAALADSTTTGQGRWEVTVGYRVFTCMYNLCRYGPITQTSVC